MKCIFVGVALLTCLSFLDLAEAGTRIRRSPFKKHKIVFAEEGPPPPPPTEETVVEHHHHYHDGPPPPPAGGHQEGFRIEFSKDKGKGKLDKKKEEAEEVAAAIDDAFEQFEKDKKEKMDKFKDDVDEKLDMLAKIPEKIASDFEFFGGKIKDELERKKEELERKKAEHDKDKGISIQIWKNKGGHHGGGSESTEVVHHHHYHGSSSEEGAPRSPPKKSFEDDAVDMFNKFGDGVISFLEDIGGHQYRSPESESEEYRYGHGGKRKGFQFNIWKDKSGRK